MSDLSPEELELLSTFREEWGPTKETKDAVRAALPAALLATPALGPDGATPPAPTTSSPSLPRAEPGLGRGPIGASRGLWAGAGAAVIGLCTVGLLVLRSGAPAPSGPAPLPARDAPVASATLGAPTPIAQPSPSPQTEAVSLDSLPNAPPQNPSAARGSGQASPASLAAPAASGDTLADELVLLREAQNALRSGAPDEAIAALSKHATRFPRGVLREERMTLQVLALCDRGDVTAARAARADLEKVAPGSSHLQRLASSCAAR